MKTNTIEFLKIQIDFNNNVISKNISGISNEEAMIFPNGNINCANWIMGHIIFVRNAMIIILGGNAVWEEKDFLFYNRGAKPIEHKEFFPDFETLKSYFKDSENELNRILLKSNTIENDNLQDLAGLMFHEIYHCGQIGILRRFLGKEGAIK